MRVRYLDWKEGIHRLEDRTRLLKRLFAILLVQEDGDVERALEMLKLIGAHYGLFDEDLTFEDFKDLLLSEKLISAEPSGFSLTPKGERFVRLDSLDQIFSHLKRGELGAHPSFSRGPSGERLSETRPYQFGDDPSEIDYVSSYRNASSRLPREGLMLREEDLRVFESEQHVSVATALLVDVSHSMVLYGEDRITPAKRVALALVELIRTRYPRDALHVILFGDAAREISVRELIYAGVGPYHTNTQDALRLARRILLRKKHTNKQIFMITDGKPSALFEGGSLYLNPFGLDPKIVSRTLEEAAECRRQKILITTFMLAREPLLVKFVENLTRVNCGRAFFSSLDRLEETVFVDFIRNRQRKVR
jgi:Ca-activated chloride channel family protein